MKVISCSIKQVSMPTSSHSIHSSVFPFYHILLIPDPISFHSSASSLIHSLHNRTSFHYIYPSSYHPLHVLPFSHPTLPYPYPFLYTIPPLYPTLIAHHNTFSSHSILIFLFNLLLLQSFSVVHFIYKTPIHN